MYRIDNATAVAIKPTKGDAGTQGYWTKGDPAQGIPATIMDGDFFNMLQGELEAILIAGGISPDKADDTQVATAIQAIITANSGGSSSSEEIYQPAHGFAKFDAVLHNGTVFAGAKGDIPANASVVGIVGEVADVDNFTIYYGGILEWDVPASPDYTVGNDIWLSPTTSKGIVDVEPTYVNGQVRQYLGEALPSGLLVNIDLGEVIDNVAEVANALWNANTTLNDDHQIVEGDLNNLLTLTGNTAEKTFTLKATPADKEKLWIGNDSDYRLTVVYGSSSWFVWKGEAFKFSYSTTLGKWVKATI